MQKKIRDIIDQSLSVKEKVKKTQVDNIAQAVEAICTSLKAGGKLIVFGNGGSAADAQHMVAEFIGRFKKERSALSAIALSTNTSSITAIGNDYGYENTFTRQLEGLARPEDIVLAISTSGNSANIIKAVKTAKKLGNKVIGLAGVDGGELATLADIAIVVEDQSTPRVQESHILIIHAICELTEEILS